MLKHPRGGVSQKQMAAIMAKLKNHEKVGFPNMVVYLMNERNHRTGGYFTKTEAEEIAAGIYRKQQAHKGQSIKQERK